MMLSPVLDWIDTLPVLAFAVLLAALIAAAMLMLALWIRLEDRREESARRAARDPRVVSIHRPKTLEGKTLSTRRLDRGA